jgi:hypothetical protein
VIHSLTRAFIILYGMYGDAFTRGTVPPIYPAHPVEVARGLASATPSPCEGSRGHLRDSYVWELEEDLMAVRRGVSPLEGVTVGDSNRAIATDACRAINRWMAEDRS